MSQSPNYFTKSFGSIVKLWLSMGDSNAQRHSATVEIYRSIILLLLVRSCVYMKRFLVARFTMHRHNNLPKVASFPIEIEKIQNE